MGGSNNVGTIFRVDPDGTVNTMITFGGGIGGYPQEGLIQANDGSFYGTTYQSGGEANGSIFRMTPEGVFTTLHWFDCSQGEGIGPICRLMQTPDGGLYGTTFYGGASGCMGNSSGTAFRITTNGVFTTVVSFDRTNGANPQCGLILGRDRALYGSTTGLTGDAYGTIFRLTTNGLLSTLHTFNVEVDGSLWQLAVG
ncbi:MAG TPA: choice-of-anchor tandem repeat GloVer-containing protein [Verrucomicrobiae bacterium]|nr:choice-of-anchor tandem repeat GloVer-containing protein [Verrucomicrobiae bacterium]